MVWLTDRNIWKNDYQKSLDFIQQAVNVLGADRILIAPSSSLLHSPHDLDLENNEAVLTPEIKNWMAFAKQKLHEVAALAKLAGTDYKTERSIFTRIRKQLKVAGLPF